ncbi:MAG: amidohydrolase, partial [Deltaproteobacteria bacterium]|nr:amidohydrolase [Deltaproteobacteria bacterium]
MIIDSHVHLFPDNLFNAIWRWFDTYAWQIKYKLYSEDCIQKLTDSGREKIVSYNYAHKPGVASYLNVWNNALQKSHPGLVVFGAIHPDDEDITVELDRIFRVYEFAGIKLHCHVISRSPDHESFCMQSSEYSLYFICHA